MQTASGATQCTCKNVLLVLLSLRYAVRSKPLSSASTRLTVGTLVNLLCILCRMSDTPVATAHAWSEPVMLKALDVAATVTSTAIISLAFYFGIRGGMRGLGKHLEGGMRNMMLGEGAGAHHMENGLDKLGKWLASRRGLSQGPLPAQRRAE